MFVYLVSVFTALLVRSLALIYQSCVKTGTDLNAELVVRQDTRVIYETFVSDPSQHTNDRFLINAAAEFDRH